MKMMAESKRRFTTSQQQENENQETYCDNM